MDESVFRNQLNKDKGVHRGKMNVLVATKETPSDKSLHELESFGPEVEDVTGNKITGAIEASKLDGLRHHALIAEVELSTRLRPHG